jgi:hypothetical protein
VATAAYTPFLVLNNLSINKRNGGGGEHFAVSNAFITGTVAYSSNYNTFISYRTTSCGQWGASSDDFGTWKVDVSGDDYSYYAQSTALSDLAGFPASINVNNLFYNGSYETNGQLGIDSTKAESWIVAGKAIGIGNVVNDFFTRSSSSSFPSSIGAHDITPEVIPPVVFSDAAPSPSGVTNYVFCERQLMAVTWGSTGTLPSSSNLRYFSGKPIPPNFNGGGAYAASYWQLTVPNGSGYTYSPNIFFSPAEKGTVPYTNTNIKLAFYDGANWSYLGPSATADVSGNPGWVVISDINNTLGASTAFTLTDANSPLPIRFLYINANTSGRNALVKWSVEEDGLISLYDIERSTDGQNFTRVSSRNANINTSAAQTYLFTDIDAASLTDNFIYYRIRMIERSGRAGYSPVVKIKFGEQKGIIVKPLANPFDNTLAIRIVTDKKETARVALYDMTGRKVVERNIVVEAGTNSLLIAETAAIASGQYLLHVDIGNNRYTEKVIKK